MMGFCRHCNEPHHPESGCAAPLPPEAREIKGDTPWTVEKMLHVGFANVLDAKGRAVVTSITVEDAERIVAYVNNEVAYREAWTLLSIRAGRAEASDHVSLVFMRRAKKAEAALAAMTEERDKHKDETVRLLNQTTKLLDVERRRWYAALGVEDGFSPEVIGARLTAEIETLKSERDRAREIARELEPAKLLGRICRLCGEAPCREQCISRKVASWPTT